jgi:N6-adenosine-specific RNA methylase IME4
MNKNTDNIIYDVVYADPPWQQSRGGKKSARPKSSGLELPYQTIGLDEIEEILGRYPSKVLFLWTIDKYLYKAESIGNNLSYKLHARIIWDKVTGIPAAFTIRYSHEYLLWMYKSPMLPINIEVRGKYRDVITEQVTAHSKKPLKAYEMIEAFYPDATKIELFARNYRHGWESVGNQLNQSILDEVEK